jgi:hypothetical protein
MAGRQLRNEALRDELLRLLREDEEFRLAVLGLLGLEEILKRIDENTNAIKSLQEQVKALQEQVKALQEAVLEQSRLLREMTASIHAIGLRYGLSTEAAFRSAVSYLVEDLLKQYRVEKWIHVDEEGLVYGHKAVVEVEVLIRDEEHVLVEYKAVADRGDVGELIKIGKLYEKVTGVKPKLLLVAAAARRRALELARAAGVEVRAGYIEPG